MNHGRKAQLVGLLFVSQCASDSDFRGWLTICSDANIPSSKIARKLSGTSLTVQRQRYGYQVIVSISFIVGSARARLSNTIPAGRRF